jgi:uncharacterized surface anchored protein
LHQNHFDCHTFAAKPKMITMKKMIGTFTAIFFLLITTLLAESKSTPAPNAAATAVVSGQVLDMATGEALAGASITIDGTETKTFTDFNGRFSMNGLVPGKYNIKVSYISYDEVTIEQVYLNSTSDNLKVKLATNGNKQ